MSQGDDALKDVHPFHQQRVGTKRSHHAQLTPYPSHDMEKFNDLYNKGRILFRPLFEWVQSIVRISYLVFISLFIHGRTVLSLRCMTIFRRRMTDWRPMWSYYPALIDLLSHHGVAGS